ncbi:hypothetical protein NliqN6_5445 [Naganishia liquefaciens]|uniref:Uncharacterized protein n=1 Tax=Naganishia liquefaciens TaxID=104408 RepID=A0A8H3TY95_9TREE|nr:hypothetical protein NliqN6_5445 [Naganishia liquefaciens]
MSLNDLAYLRAHVDYLQNGFELCNERHPEDGDANGSAPPRHAGSILPVPLVYAYGPDDTSLPAAVCLVIGANDDDVGWAYKPKTVDLYGISVYPGEDSLEDDSVSLENATEIEAVFELVSRNSDLDLPRSTMGTIAEELGKFSDVLLSEISQRQSREISAELQGEN